MPERSAAFEQVARPEPPRVPWEVPIAAGSLSAPVRFGEVEHINSASFQEKVLRSEAPVVVDFYADWCGPCRKLGPILEEFAREEPGIRVVKINVDQNRDLAARYGVSALPSVKVFKNGKITAQHRGLAGKEQLRSLVAR